MRGIMDDQIDQEEASAHMKIILTDLFNSVKKDERQLFNDFFADHVLSMDDFENGKNYVFNSYKGDLKNIECNLPMGTGESIGPNVHIFYAFTSFKIITTDNEYTVYVQFYTKNPETEYKIMKFKLLDKQAMDNGDDFSDMGLRYGIYYPGWVDKEMK